MPNWNTGHAYGLAVEGTEAEIKRVFQQTRAADPSAVLNELGIIGYIYCSEEAAAMMCKLTGAAVKLIRKP